MQNQQPAWRRQQHGVLVSLSSVLREEQASQSSSSRYRRPPGFHVLNTTGQVSSRDRRTRCPPRRCLLPSHGALCHSSLIYRKQHSAALRVSLGEDHLRPRDVTQHGESVKTLHWGGGKCVTPRNAHRSLRQGCHGSAAVTLLPTGTPAQKEAAVLGWGCTFTPNPG